MEPSSTHGGDDPLRRRPTTRGGDPPQPASSSGEPPPDSKAAAEAKARHERDKAKFATLLNLHQEASSSGEPAPGSKESSGAEQRHEARMAALQAQTGQTPAAASHSRPTQPQTDGMTGEATSQQHPTAIHIPTGGPVPAPFPLDSPVTWSTPANYYLASMGGYLPPNPMPPPLPISQHSYAHFRYIAYGGWAFCVLSRTSPATPSYQRVKRRGFARVGLQGRQRGGGPLLSMGAQGEVHPLRVAAAGGSVWHLFLRAYPREREPGAAAFQTGHYRLQWDGPAQQPSLTWLDPEDGELIHRTRRQAQGNLPNMSAHLQEHELQQMVIDAVEAGAIYMLRGRTQFPVEDPFAPRGHRAAALRASLEPGGRPSPSRWMRPMENKRSTPGHGRQDTRGASKHRRGPGKTRHRQQKPRSHTTKPQPRRRRPQTSHHLNSSSHSEPAKKQPPQSKRDQPADQRGRPTAKDAAAGRHDQSPRKPSPRHRPAEANPKRHHSRSSKRHRRTSSSQGETQPQRQRDRMSRGLSLHRQLANHSSPTKEEPHPHNTWRDTPSTRRQPEQHSNTGRGARRGRNQPHPRDPHHSRQATRRAVGPVRTHHQTTKA